MGVPFCSYACGPPYMPPGGPVLRVVLWEVGGPVLLDSDAAAFLLQPCFRINLWNSQLGMFETLMFASRIGGRVSVSLPVCRSRRHSLE